MLRKLVHAAAALALVVGIAASTAQPAEAHRRGVGAGLAIGTIIGLGIAGAYSNRAHGYYDEGPACYRGPRQCDYVGRRCWYNSYGERVCRGGEYRCWRPTYCD